MENKMNRKEDKKSKESSFMLKEYERVYTQVLNDAEHAEKRVNFFLTITSAAVGVLVVLSQLSSVQPRILSVMTQEILIILLLYGVIIQNRLISGILKPE
jgi:hypothetical protein